MDLRRSRVLPLCGVIDLSPFDHDYSTVYHRSRMVSYDYPLRVFEGELDCIVRACSFFSTPPGRRSVRPRIISFICRGSAFFLTYPALGFSFKHMVPSADI